MSTSIEAFTMIFLFSAILSILINSSAAADTITANQTIRDGDTIVSAGGDFELGFYSPVGSKNRYLGIWYKKISNLTVVWVANRAIPLTDTSGVLKVDSPGILVLLNSRNNVIWSSNTSISAKNPVAQLLDTGNLVMRDESDQENLLWQSFDYPGDTSLPGMKLGNDLVTGLKRYLSSWKSIDDPSPGDYTGWLDPNGYPEIFLTKGSVIQFRSGPFNGLRFSGIPNLKPNSIYTYEFVVNKEEQYFKYELVNSSVFTRMVLDPWGVVQRFVWNDRNQEWILYLTAQMDNCDTYAWCGPNGICIINDSPPCGCLKGFEPKLPKEWNTDWSNGCVRSVNLNS